MKKGFPILDPESILENSPRIVERMRSNVVPPYTDEELKKILAFRYLWYKFFQENNLTTRQLVDRLEDAERVVLKVKDLTEEGMVFWRNAERFLNLQDFNVNPEDRVKEILVKELQQLRSEKAD